MLHARPATFPRQTVQHAPLRTCCSPATTHALQAAHRATTTTLGLARLVIQAVRLARIIPRHARAATRAGSYPVLPVSQPVQSGPSPILSTTTAMLATQHARLATELP